MFQTADHNIQVLVPFIYPEFACKIIICKICSFQNMKKLEFDSLHRFSVQIFHSGEDIAFFLPRKPQYGVRDHFYPPRPKIFHSHIETGKRIPPSDIPGCFFMDRLQSKLRPYRFPSVQAFQQVQHVLAETVRPRAYRKSADLRMFDRLCKNLFQIFHRRVGIGISLKIGDKLPDRPFFRKDPDLGFNLLCDGESRVRGKVSASARAAENTSSCSQRAVPVRTGHSAVQRHLINLFAKTLSEHIVQRAVRFSIPVFLRYFHQDLPPSASTSLFSGIYLSKIFTRKNEFRYAITAIPNRRSRRIRVICI